MIKTYLYDDETKEMVTNLDLGDVHEKLRNPDNLLWIDLYDVHGQELAQIAKLFDFHPLAIEDCLHDSPRAKMDDYEDYKFFVFHALRYNEESDDEITTLELNAFVGSNYVVTIHKHKMGWLRKMDAVCSRYPKFMNRGADFLLYALIDGITDEYFPILDRIDMRIDELEDEIYNKEVRGVTEEFLALKRTIILIRRVILPQRRIFLTVNGKWKFDIREENVPFYIDLLDHLERIVDSAETFRDLVNSALDTYYSITNATSSEKLNVLTLISTIMLPLTFVTGFFGMNVPIPYQNSHWATAVIIVMLIVLTWGMWKYFKNKQLL
ncbi:MULTISPECIES: magnesium/cobalt transporter CorA [Priestia]|jgi:magnesium transporter|uniref:Magnesium transport protein CorA n=9 Tax=Priestia TaxID=2800373 RepID=D5DZ35_PRIM1|nr:MULTISPECIES: magnesium/cobalt transporter CorA [Priestia]AVX07271.1 magnesium and cobalt transport protein CorA [Bacillus sp. Y-01]KOP73465.1 magnesium transporter [Bacillus sp. FJAT-21351]KQU26812.1 magnesium transporter [Bacillus sp. Leaf75]KRD84487.1 magnesium transporter [Bacillus sp. Root147]KRE10512.1 magnesium transporter [Bacillus sp. Root239]KRF53096.1 magnesium transporter [Bacillus sp. Soil531]MBK0007219.1 magnesium/cobalt transporter CorA [Bacillus sp. S35]MBK0291245.1 magne